MPKIITERLKQNIEAYSTSPETAKGIWGGSVSLILSSKLNNRLTGKLFYLVGDNYSENLAYGIIKLMPGEKVRKNDLPKLSEQHGLTNEQIEKKWPNKQVLYSYKFKTLDIFPSPILVKVDPKTKIIENMGTNDDISEIELNKNLFNDIILSENFIGFEGNSIYINEAIDLNNIIRDKLSEELPFSQYVNFNNGNVESGVYRLKLEKINNDVTPLVEVPNNNKEEFEFDEELKSKLNDSTKYAIEEVMSDDIVIIQKSGEDISVLNKGETSFELTKEYESDLKMLYGGSYVIKAYNSDKLQVFDCLYFNSSNLTEDKWFNRRNKLNSMNFNNNIQKLDSTVVDSVDSVMIAIKLRSLAKSDVSVKECNLTYNLSNEYIKKFVSEDVRVHDVYVNDVEEQLLTCSNEGFFKTWSPRMAYYLGFIVTDGHVDYPNGLVEIMISNEDKEILNGIASSLGGISPKPINNSLRLRWRSKKMLEDLKKLKATGLKESRTTYKIVPEAYKWDFLRGMFDADGNNYKGRLQMDNSCGGSLKWAHSQFKTIAGKDAHIYEYTKHWKSPHHKLVILGEGAKKLHKKLYSRKPYLSRKGKFTGK